MAVFKGQVEKLYLNSITSYSTTAAGPGRVQGIQAHSLASSTSLLFVYKLQVQSDVLKEFLEIVFTIVRIYSLSL
jgi:hypothetical protein